MWTGVGDRTWNGNLYKGGGELLDVQQFDENTDQSSTSVQVTLAVKSFDGLTDIVAEVMAASIHGRLAKIAQGWLDSSGGIVVDPIYLRWDELSTIEIDEDQNGGIVITVTMEEQLEDLDRSQRYRATLSTQVDIDGTDTGFRYLATLDQEQIKWGDLFFKSTQGG